MASAFECESSELFRDPQDQNIYPFQSALQDLRLVQPTQTI
jgi:hypothetical protein